MCFYSNGDTDVKALISHWLSAQEEEDRNVLQGWIDDFLQSTRVVPEAGELFSMSHCCVAFLNLNHSLV